MVSQDVGGHTLEKIALTLDKHFNPILQTIHTPVNVDRLEVELRGHPDRLFVNNLIHNMTWGFNIGYHGPHRSRVCRNLRSARENPIAAGRCILKELKHRRLASPFSTLPLPNLQISPIGLVPKKDSEVFQLMMDLSYPKGDSINDYIDPKECSIKFDNLDRAVQMVAQLGKGALMAKLDIKSAYCLCPVRKEDWELLGLQWEDKIFIDLCLAFGLCPAGNRFNRLAEALCWILSNKYLIEFIMHYLDDFFLTNRAGSETCRAEMGIVIKVFEQLGIPLALEKIIGPTTALVFLGILIDTSEMCAKLPTDKLSELLSSLAFWESRKKCTKRELLSLIGKLSFAAKVIPSSRTFVRHLIDLSTTVSKLDHHISLNKEARADIRWWLDFLPQWNRKSCILNPHTTLTPDMKLFTDASGGMGFGIYFEPHWVAEWWPPEVLDNSIEWKELFPY